MLHYTTALTEIYGSPVPVVGALDLQVDAGGIVRGYYHPAGVRSFDTVDGGRDGDHIWLDIGAGAEMHVTGTVAPDGSIDAQAWNDDADTQYHFTAKLVTATPSPV